jgi:hypothetical protein
LASDIASVLPQLRDDRIDSAYVRYLDDFAGAVRQPVSQQPVYALKALATGDLGGVHFAIS